MVQVFVCLLFLRSWDWWPVTTTLSLLHPWEQDPQRWYQTSAVIQTHQWRIFMRKYRKQIEMILILIIQCSIRTMLEGRCDCSYQRDYHCLVSGSYETSVSLLRRLDRELWRNHTEKTIQIPSQVDQNHLLIWLKNTLIYWNNNLNLNNVNPSNLQLMVLSKDENKGFFAIAKVQSII